MRKRFTKLQPQFQHEVNLIAQILMAAAGYKANGITGHVTDTQIGKASPTLNQFTIPYRVYKDRKRRRSYYIYYIAHELSHLVRMHIHGKIGNHDAEFYEIFKQICPEKWQHYELNYKKSCKKYGITKT